LERHRSALRMRYLPLRRRRHRDLEQAQVPPPERLERGERHRGLNALVRSRPLVLIEGLHSRVIFGERLPQAKPEDELAVGQVRNNLPRTPLPRCGRFKRPTRPHLLKQRRNCTRSLRQNLRQWPSIQKLLVRIQIAHSSNLASQFIVHSSQFTATALPLTAE